MRSIKPLAALTVLVLVALLLVNRDNFTRKSPPALVVPVSSVQNAASAQVADVTGLPIGRGLPPKSPAAVSHTMNSLISYEKDLEQDINPRDLTLARLAQVCFELGEEAGDKEKQKWYEKGVRYADLLIREMPGRVEGYYWRAINLCGISAISRASTALSTLPEIVRALKTALDIDETYDQGGPARVLGRILGKAPPWPISEGDPGQSLVLLRLAIKIAPENSTNHLYLAEALMDNGDAEEGCRELDNALDADCHATSSQRLKEDKEQALTLMSQCATRTGRTPAGREKSIAVSIAPTASARDFAN